MLEQEIQDKDSSIALLKECIELGKELDCELGKWSLVVSYLELGSRYREVDERQKLYESALRIAEELQKDHTQYDYKDALAKCYTSLGGVLEDKKEYEQALEYYLQALELYGKAVQDVDSENARYLQALGYLDVARCLEKSKRSFIATKYLEDGYGVIETLVEESGKLYVRLLQNVYLCEMAEVCERQGDTSQAIQYMEQAVQHAEELVEKESSLRAVSQYMRACFQMARLYQRAYKFPKGNEYNRKGLDCMKQLLEHDNSVDADMEQLDGYLRQMADNDQVGNIENTEWYLDRIIELLIKTEGKRSYASFYYEFAKMTYVKALDYMDSYRTCDKEKAKKYFAWARDLGGKIILIERSDEYLDFLAYVYKAEALLYWNEEDIQTALVHYRNASAAFQELYERTGDAKYEEEFKGTGFREGWANQRIAKEKEGIGQLEEAVVCFKNTLDAFLRISADAELVASVYEEIGLLCWELGEYEESITNYIEARNLFKCIAEGRIKIKTELTEENILIFWRDVVRISMRIAEYDTENGKYAQALAGLEPAERQMKSIVQITQLPSDYEMLYYVQDQICEIKAKAGDTN